MAGLYFHIPFCKRVCAYCDFYKSVDLRRMDPLLESMHRELDARREYLGSEPVRTRYFGGGTPSLCAPEAVTGLLDHAATLFDCTAAEETTLEANPDDLTPAYLAALRRAGVNRLSVGIQSFDDACLKLMNRRHNAAQAVEAVRSAQREGYENITVDLIFGVPGFGNDTLRRSLVEDFGIVEPRIAVMALNPHAGDGGLLGREEQEIIRPAIVEAFSKGVLAFGPFAADGLFAGGGYAKYDGILAMYHDQGLAPFKSLSPDGVNFTAGLSAVRTSPDHGTAFDIAGKDKADPQSMRNAIYAAIDIAEHRRAWAEWTRNPLQRAERDRGGRDVSVRDLPQTEKDD